MRPQTIYTETHLLNLSMEALVGIYNSQKPSTPAGAKTFASRAKAIGRILALQAQNGIGTGKPPSPAILVRRHLEQASDPTKSAQDVDSLVAEALKLIASDKLSPTAFTWPAGFSATGERLTETPVALPQSAGARATKPASSTRPNRSGPTIKVLAEALLAEVIGTDAKGQTVGFSYVTVLEKIQEAVPSCSTSNACLRWYATRMRESGIILPAIRQKSSTVLTPVAVVDAPASQE